MSTRSIVAVPHGDTWRGRYSHSDGYPTYQGAALWALVARDGVDQVVKTLVTGDHYGWSFIAPEMPSIEGVEPSRDATYGTPEYYADQFGPEGMRGDGRFALVPGYGIAYTTEKDVFGNAQSSPDDWCSPATGTWGTEFVYVLTEDAMVVYKVTGDTSAVELGRFAWTDQEPDWQAVQDLVWS